MHTRFGLLWVTLGMLTGCAGMTCDEIPRDFTTPDATVRTFVRGFLEDCKEVEYRCLSADLIAQQEISFTFYNLFRNRLESDYGFEIGLMRFLDIEGDVHSPTIDDERPTRAQVKMTVAGRDVEFVMVREASVLIDAPDLWEGSVGDLLKSFRIRRGQDGLYLQVFGADDLELLDPEDVNTLLRPGAVSGVRVEPEWKIDSFPSLIETSSEDPEEPAPDEVP